MSTVQDRPVVVVVADPDHVDAALGCAAAEAATHTCGVHLLSATGDVGTGSAAHARDVLEGALARARRVVGERTPVTSELFHGPATRAVDAVGSGARLVVLQRGDHAAPRPEGRRPAWERLAAHASAPLVIVPDLWTHRTPSGSVVTLGMDSPRRAALAREAVALAEARSATLQVVHAWWSPLFCADLRVNAEQTDRWRCDAATGLADVLDEAAAADSGRVPLVPVQLEVRHGRPAEVLADASRSSCLVVVGRGQPGRSAAGQPLGAVTTALVRDAACPVLLVPTRSEVQTARQPVTGDHLMRRVDPSGLRPGRRRPRRPLRPAPAPSARTTPASTAGTDR